MPGDVKARGFVGRKDTFKAACWPYDLPRCRFELNNNGLSSIFGKADLTLTRTLLIESGEVNGLFFWALSYCWQN